MTTPIAVLLSGRGSNFLALHAAIAKGEIPASIALVLSNVESAPGLDSARGLGLRTLAIPHRGEPSRAAHEAKVLAALAASGAEWICLAGYMRLLSNDFVAAYRHRILNIHPSLLPCFAGLHPQRQALDAGVRVSGCTVHLVDEGLDSGPIVVQRTVPVLDGDDERALAARILEQEHVAYPEALNRLLVERWSLDGRRVRFSGPRGAAE
ncbi:MAG: phosphoribosylglycinamide formyltransferase [Myxococcota bacterium]